MNIKLPYICPYHPRAKIYHEWDQNHYVMNGESVGCGWQTKHNYYCNECGRELASNKE